MNKKLRSILCIFSAIFLIILYHFPSAALCRIPQIFQDNCASPPPRSWTAPYLIRIWRDAARHGVSYSSEGRYTCICPRGRDAPCRVDYNRTLHPDIPFIWCDAPARQQNRAACEAENFSFGIDRFRHICEWVNPR